MENVKVNKSDFEVVKFNGGYYGICNTETNECIYGGDSADEDCYDLESVNYVMEKWDGHLIVQDDTRYIDTSF